MTHRKITVKVEQQPDSTGADFATLADQLIQESSYLPPQGDQSWREQDARRIFSEQSEDDINPEEAPPAEIAAREEEDALSEPGFRSPRALGILLPVSLATFVIGMAVTFSMPEVLTAGFWNPSGSVRSPDVVAVTPVSVANAAPLAPAPHEAGPSKLRPSLAESVHPAVSPVHMADKVKTLPDRRVAQAAPSSVAPKAISSRPPDHMVADMGMGQTEQKPRARQSRLPPIGEAYFASHAHVAEKTSSDWKTVVAKWDERAAQIRARRARESDEFP